MYCCLCGDGDLLALAFEFSPVVERSSEGVVTFDASGLDRLFGLPQDVAAAVARRRSRSNPSGCHAAAEGSWQSAVAGTPHR